MTQFTRREFLKAGGAGGLAGAALISCRQNFSVSDDEPRIEANLALVDKTALTRFQRGVTDALTYDPYAKQFRLQGRFLPLEELNQQTLDNRIPLETTITVTQKRDEPSLESISLRALHEKHEPFFESTPSQVASLLDVIENKIRPDKVAKTHMNMDLSGDEKKIELLVGGDTAVLTLGRGFLKDKKENLEQEMEMVGLWFNAKLHLLRDREASRSSATQIV